jgi:predicted CXXCH cytochrome family protein
MFRKLAGLTAVAGLFIAGTASAQILDSKHNFTAEIAGNTDLCAYCHTTHQADGTVADAPLWDHTLTTNSGFTPYSSITMNATMGNDTAAYGISRLCLSCHDGTVAVDSYGGGAASTFISNVAFSGGTVGAGYQSADWSQEHPISVPTTDPEVRDTPSNAETRLFSGNVECASCHDVHDQAGTSFMLAVTNDSSALCLSCHIK